MTASQAFRDYVGQDRRKRLRGEIDRLDARIDQAADEAAALVEVVADLRNIVLSGSPAQADAAAELFLSVRESLDRVTNKLGKDRADKAKLVRLLHSLEALGGVR